MGIDIVSKINTFNCIVRTENYDQIFYLNEKNLVDIDFMIYLDSFDLDLEITIELMLVYSDKKNPSSKDLEVLKLNKYLVNKNGFILDESEDDGANTELTKGLCKSGIGLTKGFRSDLNLKFEEIELRQGTYELTVISNDKVLSLFPFEVRKK